MKTYRWMLAGAFAALFMTTAAQAQTTNVRAEVPFSFIAGDRQYPAGEYNVKSIAAQGVVIGVSSVGGQDINLLMSNACRTAEVNVPDQTKLVFRQIGDNYFLYQVWTQGNQAGREFARSKAERMLAQNHEPSDLVIVAANIAQ